MPDVPSRSALSGAELLIETLRELGVEFVFGYPGGAVLPIYDALFKQGGIRHILVRQEGGAVHAAEGYARSTGKPGVVLVTSGPGATNAVTGIADAWLDSIPLVVITGQVPTGLIGTDAFQECDTIGITRHCTKHNYLLKDPADVADVVRGAFHLATSGRPGPVVVDFPKDVQVASGGRPSPATMSHRGYRPPYEPDSEAIDAAVHMLADAKRPVIYSGGGVINAGPRASEALRQLAALSGAPVTSTLMGLGAFPASSPQWLGMLGMHGTYEANMAMNRADMLLCVGARFDDRVTGRLDAFAPHSRKVHIDIDRSSVNKNVRIDLAVIADAGRALEEMVARWHQRNVPPVDLTPWREQIDKWRARDCLAIPSSTSEIIPQQAIRRLWEMTRDRSPIISTEVGQHQMWAAQHFRFERPNKWLTSGGLGTMGYGLPAAIGAQLGAPDALVIDIAGEASIQMNIQEMSTAVQYRLPVKVFILNNEYMGMVRQWQELNYSSRYAESYSAALPDFVALAEAYGWKGIRIASPDQLDEGIAAMLAHDGPVMVDCRVAKLANCFPMILSGGAHTEMILQDGEVSGELSDEGKALV
jgi:acetolactate synthase-1/2/3 large subunit